jgi:hypothetical protein
LFTTGDVVSMRGPDERDSSDPAFTGRRRFLRTLGAVGVAGLAGCGGDDGTTPTGTATSTGTSTPTETPTVTEITPTGSVPTDTPTRTPPDVEPIAPVTPNDVGEPPEDAEILFGGDVDTLEKFESRGGGEAPWVVADDGSYFEIDVGTGDIVTRQDVGDCHLHVEFSPPDETNDTGQAKGNSGIKMMERYEFQILNNWENDTYSDGLAGAIYGQSPPLVDPYRAPTEWQVYDILWRPPEFEDGEVAVPARATAFLNGVLVQVHSNFQGVTGGTIEPYEPHPPELPILLQDHGDSANRYRNVWYRDLPPESEVESNTDSTFQPEYNDSYQEEAFVRDPGTPAKVDPGASFRDPPSDATVLLGEDGSLDGWESAGGGDPGWREEDGYVAVEPGGGNIRTTETFGDCQLHAEFRIPADVDGVGRNRGNSGLLLADRYELQILDNVENVSEHDRWVGAYTGQAPPLASPIRPPGEWQAVDVVWEGPRFSTSSLDRPARLTALLNGVAVQNRLYLNGPNAGGSVDAYESHPHDAPLGLQEEGDPVHFRNVWYRDIE